MRDKRGMGASKGATRRRAVRNRSVCLVVLTALGFTFSAVKASDGYVHPAPKKTEVAPGIYLFQTEPYGDVGLDGNSIAITSGDGVLVFDANGTPAAARAVIAEIRKITDKPV